MEFDLGSCRQARRVEEGKRRSGFTYKLGAYMLLRTRAALRSGSEKKLPAIRG